MRQKLISKQVEQIVNLKNYYKGLRLIELRLIYQSKLVSPMDKATLNRMDKESLINAIVESILKPLDN